MAFISVKNINKAKIAMTDLETSGDVFGVHEILEIGLVVFDSKSFEIIDTFEAKIKSIILQSKAPDSKEFASLTL